MTSLFGGGSRGPSAEELRRENIDRAKQRERDIRSLASRERDGGVFELFGPSNPALNIPGGTDGMGNNSGK